MVRSDTNAKVFFAHKDQLLDSIDTEDTENTHDDKSSNKRRGRRKLAEPKNEKIVVVPQVPMDTRINLNTLTAEGLTQALPGVGIKTAKEIIELRQSLSGERFSKLEQLKAVKRFDWDEVFATGDVYVE